MSEISCTIRMTDGNSLICLVRHNFCWKRCWRGGWSFVHDKCRKMPFQMKWIVLDSSFKHMHCIQTIESFFEIFSVCTWDKAAVVAVGRYSSCDKRSFESWQFFCALCLFCKTNEYKILPVQNLDRWKLRLQFLFFYVLLTVHLSTFILLINKLDAQNLIYNKFISCLYMFRAPCTHRQEIKNCIIQPLVSSHL